MPNRRARIRVARHFGMLGMRPVVHRGAFLFPRARRHGSGHPTIRGSDLKLAANEAYMREALTLAEKGAGRTRPNPQVGAVVVKGGRVVGRGWHAQLGAPHAECAALADAGSLPELIADARARGERVGVIGTTDVEQGAELLGVPRDGDEYAHDLYRMLRDADARGLDRVIAILPDPTGLGAAVADRLRRASRARE